MIYFYFKNKIKIIFYVSFPNVTGFFSLFLSCLLFFFLSKVFVFPIQNSKWFPCSFQNSIKVSPSQFFTVKFTPSISNSGRYFISSFVFLDIPIWPLQSLKRKYKIFKSGFNLLYSSWIFFHLNSTGLFEVISKIILFN